MARPLIDPAVLHELLIYDAEQGSLMWRERGPKWFAVATDAPGWNAKYAAMPALSSINVSGYLRGTLLGQSLLAHRVCWALYEGAWPISVLDHINGNRTDNRRSNLREASPAENRQNVASRSGSTSRFVGVSKHKATGRWQAFISVGRAQRYLGLFDTENDAFSAYCAAKKKLHEFNPTPREISHVAV